MNTTDGRCPFCQGHIVREHLRIDDRVVCPYREITRNNLQHFWCEGFHKLAEVTAARLGLELGLPEKPLLERLMVPRQGMEETPTNLPPVGLWDPAFLRDLRPSTDTTEEFVVDHESTAPTLLVDSGGQTIRHGSAFEYWSRVTETLGSNEFVREPSEMLDTGEDRRPIMGMDWIESRFQNIISTLRSKATTIAFPIHSRNIATVQEMVACDSFPSIVIEPTSPADFPVIVIARHKEALEQFTRAGRDFRTSPVHRILNVPYLVPFLACMVIGLVIAAW